MPVYKDKERNTWYVRFKEKNWKGELKDVWKRGFKTKHDASQWEIEYKSIKKGEIDLNFEAFVKEIYLKNLEPRIKLSTTMTKNNIINKQIIPYFGKKKINEISTTDVIAWQNEMMTVINHKTGKKFSKSFLQSIHQQLNAIFNYAAKYYKLPKNPAHIVGNMGSEKEIEMNFWTLDEYKQFADIMMDKPFFYYCFEVLYWCGLREGELLALSMEDIDFDKKTINITKTYHRIKKQDVITTPKTAQSYRKVTMPDFLCEELKEYISMIFEPDSSDRLFPTYKSTLCKEIKIGAKKAGIKQIRVHDLRHSHVSLLIEKGYSALAIAKRVGHKAIDITYRYAHLFPSVQEKIADSLDILNEECDPTCNDQKILQFTLAQKKTV